MFLNVRSKMRSFHFSGRVKDQIPAPSPLRTPDCPSASPVELPKAASVPSPAHRQQQRRVWDSPLRPPHLNWISLENKSHLLYALVFCLQRSDLLQGLVKCDRDHLLQHKQKGNLPASGATSQKKQGLTCQPQLLVWGRHLGLPYLLFFLYTVLQMFQHSLLKKMRNETLKGKRLNEDGAKVYYNTYSFSQDCPVLVTFSL